MPGRGALTASWLALDPALRRGLLLGSFGRRHFLEQARRALAVGQAALGAGLARAALAESPLDGALAAEILAAPVLAPHLSPAFRSLLQALARSWRVPAETGAYAELAASRDLPALRVFLDRRLAREPESLFWRNQAVSLALFENDQDWLAQCLGPGGGPELAPSFAALRGLAAHLGGDFEGARRSCAACADALGPHPGFLRQGLALLAGGEREEALRLFREGFALAPWLTGAALLAGDLARGMDRERAAIPGSLAVLLYSWNKARELDETLAALFASDLGEARVLVLDNGSTDATPAVLDAWAERAGPRLTRVDLPVNVGAPAARNWLLARPELDDADFVLFLDDDALPPPDWASLLGAAVAAHPGAGVWGCRVVDHAAPHLVQSADLHLCLPEEEDPARPADFRLSDLHVQGFDLGQFSYLRPCASVTGCCHLFRTALLRESGGFSLHLSPSQYDDVEHDLRLARAGLSASCQGHLAVRHKKRTGAASRVSPAEEGNALGNRFKMQAMHPRAEIEASLRAGRELLEADLLERLAELEGV